MSKSKNPERNRKKNTGGKSPAKKKKTLNSERAIRKFQYEFLSSVSHQMRTPIATVQSSLELLEMYIRSNNPARQYQTINKIKRNLSGLNQTLERITSLYKFNIINQKLRLSRIEPHKFVSGLLEEIIVHEGVSHLINVNIDLRKKYFKADEFILKHIMLNLINNAIKFSPEGSQILIQINSDKNKVKVSIKDEGMGIRKSDMKNLYRPFFRAKNALAVPGVGLGLAIVKRLSTLHKIKIECLSETNNGTEFILKIPQEY